MRVITKTYPPCVPGACKSKALACQLLRSTTCLLRLPCCSEFEFAHLSIPFHILWNIYSGPPTCTYRVAANMPLATFMRQRTQGMVDSVTSHRLFLYSIFSVLAVVVAIANALRNHSNFFSVAIYLSQSSRSLLVSTHTLHSPLN